MNTTLSKIDSWIFQGIQHSISTFRNLFQIFPFLGRNSVQLPRDLMSTHSMELTPLSQYTSLRYRNWNLLRLVQPVRTETKIFGCATTNGNPLSHLDVERLSTDDSLSGTLGVGGLISLKNDAQTAWMLDKSTFPSPGNNPCDAYPNDLGCCNIVYEATSDEESQINFSCNTCKALPNSLPNHFSLLAQFKRVVLPTKYTAVGSLAWVTKFLSFIKIIRAEIPS